MDNCLWLVAFYLMHRNAPNTKSSEIFFFQCNFKVILLFSYVGCIQQNQMPGITGDSSWITSGNKQQPCICNAKLLLPHLSYFSSCCGWGTLFSPFDWRSFLFCEGVFLHVNLVPNKLLFDTIAHRPLIQYFQYAWYLCNWLGI